MCENVIVSKDIKRKIMCHSILSTAKTSYVYGILIDLLEFIEPFKTTLQTSTKVYEYTEYKYGSPGFLSGWAGKSICPPPLLWLAFLANLF